MASLKSRINPSGQQSLLIWAVTDGKPGHRNQTQGLIDALGRLRAVSVIWLAPYVVHQSLVRLLKPALPLPKKVADMRQTPQLIIGAGHRTHLTLLALKRQARARLSRGSLKSAQPKTTLATVVLMRPSLPLSWFDLCLVPRHDRPPQTKAVIETIGPLNRVQASSGIPKTQGLILLGGPSSHYRWDTTAVVEQVRQIVSGDHFSGTSNAPGDITANSEFNWIIAGSRRTPPDLYRLLESQLPGVKLVKPDSVPDDWLVEQYGLASPIWVTEDSMSMVFEALSSGAPTGVIRLKPQRETRVTREISRLLAEGRLMTLDDQNVGFSRSQHPLNEAQRCATLILERFGL